MNFSILRIKSEQSAVLAASSGGAARQLRILKAAKRNMHLVWVSLGMDLLCFVAAGSMCC